MAAPSRITVVETAEGKERKEIEARARKLFDDKDYKSLEQLADQYRVSKECYPDGMWKLTDVYTGINLKQEAADAEWKAHLALLRNWVATSPNSITARVALAEALITYGWKARGSGYADTVTDEGWKLLDNRLVEAVKVLKDASTLSEKCPRQWSLLMTAAMGLGVERSEYMAVFRMATNSQPGYIGNQCSMAYYLMERWYGKPGELAAYIKKCADDVGGDDGDLLYARLAWYLQGVSDNIFIECDLPWDRVDRGFQVMEKRFPGSTYVQNGRAYMALMGSTRPEPPRTLVAGLNGNIDLKVWTSKENFIRLTKNL